MATQSHNKTPVVRSNPTSSRWQKLLKYYSSCIFVENTGKVILDLSKKGTDFLQVPAMEQEWVISGKQKLEFEVQNKDFTKSPSWSRSSISYFYGFPCHIKQQMSRGQSQPIIQPILIFDIDLVETETGYEFALQSDRPRINSAFLEDRDLLTSVEERKRIAEDILESWDDNGSTGENLKMVLDAFANLLPQGVSFSKGMFSGKTTDLNRKTGFLPIGVIFKSADSPYTRGLERELKELRNTTPNDVWRVILDRNAEVKEDDDTKLIEITGLNDEQRCAVRSAFSNTVTVVTGPPGTGKSQIVLNIIANALLHDQTVLFGSKNRKAVDIVVERLRRLQKEPIILNYGNQESESEVADALLSAIDRASIYDGQILEQEIKEYEKKIENVRSEEKEAQETLSRILECRNCISRLDKDLESIVAKLDQSISQNLDPYKQIKVKPEFYTLLESLDRLTKKIDDGPSFISHILALFGLTLEKRVLEAAASLLEVIPVDGFGLRLDSVHNCRELLTTSRNLKEWIDNQPKLLKMVRENDNELPVETLRARITECKENAIDISIQYVDVLMRYRLKSLGSEERKAVADYKTIVRSSDSGAVGNDFTDQRKQAFKSVAKAFPAIAVTNLSIRHALPLTIDAVDIAIIDEGSQCDIASALPLLYRAKCAVIIGDPSQLTHISSLGKSDDRQLQRNMELTSFDNLRFLYSTNSIFELAQHVVGTGARFVHLLEHYRSRAEIIGFSNRKFYGGGLSIWTDYGKLRGAMHTVPLAWHNVVGKVIRPPAGGAYNLNEAEGVVALIEDIIGKIENCGDAVSLGVVTPFREQANKIRVLAEEKIESAQLRGMDFIVDTAHKYQGDERDIMIFSPVISSNVHQYSLGFLSSNANLFNVSITRARTELHIVGDRVSCAQSGISYLAEFVQYVNEIEQEKNLEKENQNKDGGKFESPWERMLHDALAKEGIKTISQYPLYQYRLDLAVLDSEIPINIEVDGERWHRDIDGGRLFSDLKRDQHLIMHGWRVKRFWVYELRNDLNRCVQEVKKMLNSH
ncbi:MAG: AAA domain-containing protein [Thermodesulfobacteriota bacterium]